MRARVGQTHKSSVGAELTVIFETRDGWRWREVGQVPYSQMYYVRQLMDEIDRFMLPIMRGLPEDPPEPSAPPGQ